MANAIAFVSDDAGATPPVSQTPPANVSGITVNDAYVDPVTLQITMSVSFTPPAGGTYVGVHMWLEIPDQSSGSTTTMVVGSTPVGTGTAAGPWTPIDLGLFQAPQQPWTINLAFPNNPGLNPRLNTPCRLYLASYSQNVSNTLVRNGLGGATPNVAFPLVSLASGSPSAGTNVTVNCGTIIVDDNLANQNVSGKLVTPFLALMGSVPSNPPTGWGYRLYISYGTADPTNPANLTPVTEVETLAGVVPPPTKSDGVSILHSFAIATPTTPTNATIWALSGLTKNGVFTPNALVPGITNSCPITFGSTSGTIDASQAITSSISAELTTIFGKLGVTPGGLNASTFVSAGTIVGNLLAASNVITLSAQIGTAVVADANIASLNVSKLLAGTATFTGSAVFQSSSGPSVAIASSGITLTGSTYSVSVSSSSGISISSSSGPSIALTGSGLSLTVGSYQAVLSSSQLELTNGTNSVLLNATGVTITQGFLTLNYNSVTTAINNASFGPTGRNTGFTCTSGSFSCGVDYLGLYASESTNFGSVGVTTAGGYVSLAGGSGATIGLSFAGGSSPQLDINGVKVVGPQQAGPGSPSFTSFAQVQTWCASLYTALQAHGLVT